MEANLGITIEDVWLDPMGVDLEIRVATSQKRDICQDVQLYGPEHETWRNQGELGIGCVLDVSIPISLFFRDDVNAVQAFA